VGAQRLQAGLQAMQTDPAHNAVPYQWTLSPLSIAEGPLPPNSADIAKAQDILRFCADQRLALMDQYNLLDWWAKHPDQYEFPPSFTPAQANQAAADTQRDLDTVAECASAAIDHPKDAVRPADYAQAQGRPYPIATLPAAYPKPKPGPATVYSEPQFKGVSQVLQRGRYDNADGNLTVGNDAIQSVTVPAHLVVRLYEHFHYQGQFFDVPVSTPDLNNWDKKASSLIVYGADETPPRTTEVVLVQLPGLDTWDGPSWIFTAANGSQAQPDFPIHSAHVPAGMLLSVYPARTSAARRRTTRRTRWTSAIAPPARTRSSSATCSRPRPPDNPQPNSWHSSMPSQRQPPGWPWRRSCPGGGYCRSLTE
jgi:hypothetical protein